jgi:hypothetical protein
VPQAARDRLAARIQAIQDRTPDAPEPAPDPPAEDSPAPRSIVEAEATLAAVLPVQGIDRCSLLANGKWVDHATGLVTDEQPF